MIFFDVIRSDADVLLREVKEFAQQERLVTARLLVRLAAVEKRELYAPCGYSSMWEYCLGELGMSEESAGRRLWAARKCREFPALFDALAEGRISLTAVHTLSTHLQRENVDELVAAATGRTKAQLQDWLACRFPRPAVPTVIQAVTSPERSTEVAPMHGLLQSPPTECKKILHSLASVPVPSSAQNSPTSQVPLRGRASVDPLNAEQVKVQFRMSREALAKMKHAMDLLGAAMARDDVAALFEKLLDMAIPTLEKKKFSATNRPRAPRETAAANPRTIPAHVQREVWKRDGGRCTFASATNRAVRALRLEYDHVKPAAPAARPRSRTFGCFVANTTNRRPRSWALSASGPNAIPPRASAWHGARGPTALPASCRDGLGRRKLERMGRRCPPPPNEPHSSDRSLTSAPACEGSALAPTKPSACRLAAGRPGPRAMLLGSRGGRTVRSRGRRAWWVSRDRVAGTLRTHRRRPGLPF